MGFSIDRLAKVIQFYQLIEEVLQENGIRVKGRDVDARAFRVGPYTYCSYVLQRKGLILQWRFWYNFDLLGGGRDHERQNESKDNEAGFSEIFTDVRIGHLYIDGHDQKTPAESADFDLFPFIGVTCGGDVEAGVDIELELEFDGGQYSSLLRDWFPSIRSWTTQDESGRHDDKRHPYWDVQFEDGEVARVRQILTTMALCFQFAQLQK